VPPSCLFSASSLKKNSANQTRRPEYGYIRQSIVLATLQLFSRPQNDATLEADSDIWPKVDGQFDRVPHGIDLTKIDLKEVALQILNGDQLPWIALHHIDPGLGAG
jgi:hypothetical protein